METSNNDTCMNIIVYIEKANDKLILLIKKNHKSKRLVNYFLFHFIKKERRLLFLVVTNLILL